jgi:protein-S-isoprenylcysteine O-methyltransferase Ste14
MYDAVTEVASMYESFVTWVIGTLVTRLNMQNAGSTDSHATSLLGILQATTAAVVSLACDLSAARTVSTSSVQQQSRAQKRATTVLTAFYLLTEHFVDASRQRKKRVYEFSGPFGPQTTKTRRQARKDDGGVSSC